MDDVLLPEQTSGGAKFLQYFSFFVLNILTLVTSVLCFVNGSKKIGYVIVGIALVPVLITSVLLIRWTRGDTIDERLQRLSYALGFFVVALDLGLIIAMYA